MKKTLSIVLILCITLSILFVNNVMANPAVTFSDVTAGTEIGNAIYKLVESGAVVGYPDGTFKPDNHLTRAELSKMINLVFGYTEAATDGFVDVTDEDWFKPYVLVAKKAGYIKGFEDGSFRGNQNLSREQACAIISRCADLKETKMTINISDPVSDWAEVDVKKVISAGLMKLEEGDKFRAKEDITRGELALLLESFVKPAVKPPVIIGGVGGGTGGGGNNNQNSDPVDTYTVTFDSDGGSSVANKTVNQGASVSRPADPTKEGYTFVAWVKADGSEFNFATAITSNITLKATWQIKKYTVKFNFNGGTLNGEEILQVEVDYNETVANPGEPQREAEGGFTFEFLGYTITKGGEDEFDFSSPITANKTVYASWKEVSSREDQTELVANLNGIISNFNNYAYDEIPDEEVLLKVLDVRDNLLIAFQGAVDAYNRGETISKTLLKQDYQAQYNNVMGIYEEMPDGEGSQREKFDMIIFEIGDTYLTFLMNFFGVDL